MPDIRIDNLSFTYAGSPEPVLRALDLVIPQGEFVLLTGPSGCGKSTLALALAGLIPSRVGGHLRGSVYLDGDNLSTMNIYEASQRVGMVFQNPDNQLVQLNVEEEVAFGPENLALPYAEIMQRLVESLAYTGMGGMRQEQIYALSGGQKQRVAISATLAMRPGVLVLDEPTSDLDPVGTQEVLQVLLTIFNSGTTWASQFPRWFCSPDRCQMFSPLTLHFRLTKPLLRCMGRVTLAR